MAGKLVILKAFDCPSCGAPQKIRAGGFAGTYVCTSCNSTIDTSGERYAVLRQAESQDSSYRSSQLIPLGKRGTIDGHEFEVIGFMVRCDSSLVYHWNEYLLFNPYKGFRWLMEMNGHWNFIETIEKRPGSPGESSITYEGRRFRKFLRDQPRVRYVIGEFYWQVKVGDSVTSYDYISPPYGISCELEDGEVVWSTLEYVSPRQIQRAFELDFWLPSPEGISPTQPPLFQNVNHYVTIAIVAFLVLLFIKGIVVIAADNRTVLPQTSYFYATSDFEKIKRTEIFEIPAYGNLAVEVHSPVNNNWIEVGVDLVNADTQESRDLTLEVSYYHGVDSDGSWSEGSSRASDLLGAVEPGRYYLSLEASADPTLQTQPYTVSAKYDVGYSGNFLAALAAITIIPAFMKISCAVFESKRWEQAE